MDAHKTPKNYIKVSYVIWSYGMASKLIHMKELTVSVRLNIARHCYV